MQNDKSIIDKNIIVVKYIIVLNSNEVTIMFNN